MFWSNHEVSSEVTVRVDCLFVEIGLCLSVPSHLQIMTVLFVLHLLILISASLTRIFCTCVVWCACLYHMHRSMRICMGIYIYIIYMADLAWLDTQGAVVNGGWVDG